MRLPWKRRATPAENEDEVAGEGWFVRLPWTRGATAADSEDDAAGEGVAWLLAYPARTAAILPRVERVLARCWPTWERDRDAFRDHVRAAISTAEAELDVVRVVQRHEQAGNGTRSWKQLGEELWQVLGATRLMRASLFILLGDVIKVPAYLCLLAPIALVFIDTASASTLPAAFVGMLLGLALVVMVVLIERAIAPRTLTDLRRRLIATTFSAAAIAGIVALVAQEPELDPVLAAAAGILLPVAIWPLFGLIDALDEWAWRFALRRALLSHESIDAFLILTLVRLVGLVADDVDCRGTDLEDAFGEGGRPESIEVLLIEVAAWLAGEALPPARRDVDQVRRRDEDRARRLSAFLRSQQSALLDDRPGRREDAVEALAQAAVAYPLGCWDVFVGPSAAPPKRQPARLAVAPLLLLTGAVAVFVLPWRLGETAAAATPLVITALAQIGLLDAEGKETSAALVTALKRARK